MFLPQMAPMWWMTLEMMFIINLITMTSMIFFNKNFKTKKKLMTEKIYTKWMW